ncbi:MAG: hypothetical protein RDU01_09420 [Thermodesulfovibrionales bacterium]|nr:hypothetical protein [Thermodesulfovibrionales bacterium]
MKPKVNFYQALIITIFLLALFFLTIIFSIIQLRPETGIRKGQNVLAKKIFYKGDIGKIRTIQVGNHNSSLSKKIFILSQNKCLLFDVKMHELVKTIKFKKEVGVRPEVLKIEPDGKLEFILRGGGFGDVGVANTNGELRWKYRPTGTSPSMTSGDLDGDGNLEFYVADYDGLHRLDSSGEEQWRTNDFWEWDVQIFQPEGVDESQIITRGDDGKIRFRNKHGKIIKDIGPPERIYDIEAVQWLSKAYLLAKDEDRCIILMDLDGKVILKYCYEQEWFFNLPFGNYFYILAVRATPIKLRINEEPYLAVITDFASYISRTMLNIFSPSGELVYQELLKSTTGLNVIQNDDGTESLLVGDGGENVWLYTVNQE